MIKIVNINSIAKTNAINSSSARFSNFQKSTDTVSFTGISVRPVKNNEEIKELVNTFYDALKHNLEPNSKSCKFIEKIDRFIATLPFITSAKQPGCITEVIKSGGNLAGGYSISINAANSSAHIGFLTLAPEYIKTRTGIGFLKMIGKRICQNLEINNIKNLTWTTNSKNTDGFTKIIPLDLISSIIELIWNITK